MNKAFEYRSYTISQVEIGFVARAIDGEDPGLASKFARRVMVAIDQLWEAAEAGKMPEWFRKRTNAPGEILDLDGLYASGHLIDDSIHAGNVTLAPASIRQKMIAFFSRALDVQTKETFPSETDPPARSGTAAVAVALAVATAIAYLMHRFITESEPAIIFTLAILVTTVTFGRVYGLVLAAFAAAVYNLTVIPPEFHFTTPSMEELLYIAINLIAVFTVPHLIHFRIYERSDAPGVTMPELA